MHICFRRSTETVSTDKVIGTMMLSGSFVYKRCSVTTNGASAMVGVSNRAATVMKKHCESFHCDLHCQNLASEKLSCDKADGPFGGVMEQAVKIVNKKLIAS
jgi:hypothetical protein